MAALRDLSGTKGLHTLVAVTGGADSCSAEAGQLIAAEAKRDGIDYQLYVLWLTQDQSDAVEGLVNSAGNGHYINAHSKAELSIILNAIQLVVKDQAAATLAGVLATAAALPTGTPAQTPTPAFGLTACDNPYLPLRPGSTWTYTTGARAESWTVTAVSGGSADATATLSFMRAAISVAGEWHCTGEGIVKNDAPQYAFIPVLAASTHYKLVSSSGIWLPPADGLIAGATRESQYAVSFDSDSAPDVTTQTFSERFMVAGAEKVTVLGVTYDAVRVDSLEAIDYTFKEASGAAMAPIHFSYKNQWWYARGVGLVRYTRTADASNPTGGGAVVQQDLESYTIP